MAAKEDKPNPWIVELPPGASTEGATEDQLWKVPFWQKPVKVSELCLHPDGPLSTVKREGYLQKRAGNSRMRWNIRYFELADGKLQWWRPEFKEMLKMPPRPKVMLKEVRPRPIRSLDLSKLKSVTRTRVKFPYSTRILLEFHEDYSKYKLELRAERENIILEWYRACSRFAIECNEYVVERETAEDDSTATPGTQEDEEEGFDDVDEPASGSTPRGSRERDPSVPEEDRRRPPAGGSRSGATGGYSSNSNAEPWITNFEPPRAREPRASV